VTNHYSIDIDELIAFADRLKRFNKRAEEIATAVDQEIAKLHTTWEGVGAESNRDYHQQWMRRTGEMREAAEFLHHAAVVAQRNYSGVGQHNRGMWP
jgi:WXG100 family type VII secretion target